MAVLGLLVLVITTIATRPLQQLVAVVMAAIIIGVVITIVIDVSARRVREITRTIDRIARGQFNARVETFGPGDIGQLGNAVNRMAQRLAKQNRKRKRERDRLHTVLHTMSDGVLMLNRQGDVRMINPAAARILRVDINGSLDRSFVQVVRDHRIAEVWTRCKEKSSEQTASIELNGGTLCAGQRNAFSQRLRPTDMWYSCRTSAINIGWRQSAVILSATSPTNCAHLWLRSRHW